MEESLLQQILVTDQCKLQDLPAGLEKWDELVRGYEGASRAERRQQLLMKTDEDIKNAALEALVPSELEQHLAMNQPCTTDHVRAGSK